MFTGRWAPRKELEVFLKTYDDIKINSGKFLPFLVLSFMDGFFKKNINTSGFYFQEATYGNQTGISW